MEMAFDRREGKNRLGLRIGMGWDGIRQDSFLETCVEGVEMERCGWMDSEFWGFWGGECMRCGFRVGARSFWDKEGLLMHLWGR